MPKASQLDREISKALEQPANAEREFTAKRAKDFRDSGNYELRDASGTVVAMMYRDPESRGWYEESMPGAPQTHYTERWRGSTQAEAITRISRRLNRRPPQTHQ